MWYARSLARALPCEGGSNQLPECVSHSTLSSGITRTNIHLRQVSGSTESSLEARPDIGN
jgi:hypothetical protein